MVKVDGVQTRPIGEVRQISRREFALDADLFYDQ